MKSLTSLRQLSEISYKEKQQFFAAIFPQIKEGLKLVVLCRENDSQSEKDIVVAIFPEIKNWMFRNSDKQNTWKGGQLLNMAHYIRACRWLRARGFEIPDGY